VTDLTIQIPDDVARRLESIAAAEQKTAQQLASERLTHWLKLGSPPRSGSAAALLDAMREAPHLTAEDVEALDISIASARQPIRESDIFPE